MRLLLFERVDQFDGREEPDPLVVMFDGLDPDCRGDVRLARAGAADQNDVVGVVEEFAPVELLHERFIDLAAGEVEAIQITIGRKAGGLELICSRSHLPFGHFRFQELRQDRNGSLERRRSLLG